MGTPEAQISGRVRALLAERDISGSELARRLGLTQSYVSRRLRDDVPWRASDLALIARELGVDVSQLLPVGGDDGVVPPGTPPPSPPPPQPRPPAGPGRLSDVLQPTPPPRRAAGLVARQPSDPRLPRHPITTT